MSLIIKSKKFEVPGLKTISWDDGDKNVKYITDKNPRNRRVRLIVMHTHEGLEGDLLKGYGPNTTFDEKLALYQTNTPRYVSWDATVDMNGDVTWQNDPAKYCSWQASDTNTNNISFGIEMIQKIVGTNKDRRGHLWEGEIEKTVLLLDVLTLKMGIQRQIPWDKVNNKPVLTQIPRLMNYPDGEDMVGIVGHVMITTNKGPGDPGPYIFEALKNAGYELFDMNTEEDKKTWKQRQISFGMTGKDVDGLPLDKTQKKMKELGHKHGLWIKRPIDDLFEEI